MISLLLILSYLVILLYGLAALFCLGCGLLCLTELVEEHIVTTGKIIRYMIIGELVAHMVILFTDNVTYSVVFAGIFAHICYWTLLKQFPAFHFTSYPFIASLASCAFHQFTAIRLAHWKFFSPMEYMAYFTFFIWAVPFMFLVSLSANDLVLPQTVTFTPQRSEQEPLLLSQNDVVSAYLKKKRRSLYSVLSAIRDALPSLKSKKGF